MKTTQKIVGVYIVTGFIESGKTTLIHSMLEDKGFSRGEKTLIISCEEGIVEYDEKLLRENNCTLVQMDDKDEWIEYYIYDCSWGSVDNDVRINGEPVSFKTYEDLYDMIKR